MEQFQNKFQKTKQRSQQNINETNSKNKKSRKFKKHKDTRNIKKKPENNLEIIKISLSTYFKKTKEYELKKIWNEIHYFEMS